MIKYLPALCVLGLLLPQFSRADDIEIFVRDRSALAQPYLQLVVDYHPELFLPVCEYGPSGSCAPPYMSQRAYDLLPGTLLAGDSVSRLDIFLAILAALFENPDFGNIRISLSVPNYTGGTGILADSAQEAEWVGSGINAVMTALEALPHPETAAPPQFLPVQSYLNLARQVFPGNSCSSVFSLLWAFGEPGVDDAAGDFPSFLRQLHRPGQNLASSGKNSLEKTWVITSAGGPLAALAWSRAGGSRSPLYVDAPASLEADLNRVLREIVTISRTAVPLPGPLPWFTQTVAGDDLYLALFQPQATLSWRGNLKKLRFLRPAANPAVQIVDAHGQAGFSESGADIGRINFGALTLWTEAASLPTVPVNLAPPRADGNIVARGGAGQKIPGVVPGGISRIGDRSDAEFTRAVYVEPDVVVNGAKNVLLPLDADGSGASSTAAQLRGELGADSVEHAQDLIRWFRGQDVDDEDVDGNTSEAREWLMGQALHSRPAVLNYGAVNGYSKANPNVRIFVGTGSGVLQAIENTRTTGQESGVEVFGFVPREMLAAIAPSKEGVISSLRMSYGIDGEPVLLKVDNDGDGNLNWAPPFNDEAYLYFGLRRGGQSYYALDVSNPEAVPTLLWKISRTRGGDFDELGLSFSTPIIGKVKFGGRQVDVLIFGGGYNGGWDKSGTTRVGKDIGAADDHREGVDRGNAIYIIDARTGELIWKAVYGETTSTSLSSTNTRFEHDQLVDSIPSAVVALNTPAGNIHRLYVGDTGGAIWRVDLPVGNDTDEPDHRRENWFISKFAELGTDGLASDRRFFHPPDLVQSKEDSGAPFDGLLISSGNRAAPNETEVRNYHFYLKDTYIISGHAAVRTRAPLRISENPAESDLPDLIGCKASATGAAEVGCEASLDNGWMIQMRRPGEKGLATPLVDGGKVYFTSYVPSHFDGCQTTQGVSSLYLVNLDSGLADFGQLLVQPLGLGLSEGLIPLGDSLFSPLGSIDTATCRGKLCDSYAEKHLPIYWRQPRIDFR
jgi:type IV pilus assembly protein PilY1